MDRPLFLLVTANEHETNALLSDKSFKFEANQRSSDPYDNAFYNIGTYGNYNAIHFELVKQGSVKSDASQLAIVSAINSFHPDAVILVGIAFGQEFSDSDPHNQNIGDVLVSTTVADYESGKVKEGTLRSDETIPECGRQLLSAFKNYSKSWEHSIEGRKAKCEFGLILSGDKVVDDREFKTKLMEHYPRAIGGEMEGRGAYGACKNRGIDEWIIVKSICDWADGTKSKDKEHNQITAATSAVSLLNHIFTTPGSLDKVSIVANNTSVSLSEEVEKKNEKIGYFINFGITTCRLFEIQKHGKALKERKTISYVISDPKDPAYLKGIINHVKEGIFPIIEQEKKQIFIKAFADAGFSDIFPSDKKKNDFILDFYTETNLYFNILSQKQTEENLKKLFKSFENGTAIVNIGSQYIDIMVKKQNRFNMYTLSFSLKNVKQYIDEQTLPEIWDEKTIDQIKNFIKDNLINQLKGIQATKAVIIKDELKFMKELGYPLINEGGICIPFDEYKQANRDYLFNIDYSKYVEENYSDTGKQKRMYGFKNGHIILETIFDLIGVKKIVPSDELSIHGSVYAYIFNVAISGSTKDARANYMIEAHKIMTEMGATVLSPRIVNGHLIKQSKKTDMQHANAIRECDLLFVSNKDEYIGEQTAREIYGAFLLNKPIAFWREPRNVERLDIPHEAWWSLMEYLENDQEIQSTVEGKEE